MENLGMVSVIIPCYNYGRFLGECLDSILAQTYPYWECLVVDDGSKDNTKEIAQFYEQKDNRIKYIYQQNAGASTARNNGIAHAKGKYIQLLDADDMLESQKFEKQTQTLKDNPNCRLVFSDVKVFKHQDTKNYLFQSNYWDVLKLSSHETGFREFLLRMPFTINAPILEKKIFEEIGNFDANIKSNEDWDFWVRCMLHNEIMLYAPEEGTFPLVRLHGESHMHTQHWNIYYFRLKIRKKLEKKLPKELLPFNKQYYADESDRLVHVAIDTFREGKRWKAVKYFYIASLLDKKLRYFLYLFLSIFITIPMMNKLVVFSFKNKFKGMSYFLQKIKKLYSVLTDPIYRENRKKALADTAENNRLRNLPKDQADNSDLLGQKVYFPDAMSFIGAKHEIWDRELYQFKTQNPTPYIIDAGANIGIATLYFKKKYPNAEILAFEPDDTIFDFFHKNTKHLSNITALKKGLWKEETTLTFFSEGKEAGRIIKDNTEQKNKIEIQTLKLSNFLNRKIDFLKMDIEGAELEVLEECKHLLHFVDRFFVEYHSYFEQPQHIDRLLTILKDAGFRVHIQENLPLSPNPFVAIQGYQNMDMLLNIFAFRA